MIPGTVINPDPDVGWVYALLEPCFDRPRAFYVGQTRHPYRRLRDHRKRYDNEIYMVILEGPVAHGALLSRAERAWMAKLHWPGHITIADVSFKHGPLDNKAQLERALRETQGGGA